MILKTFDELITPDSSEVLSTAIFFIGKLSREIVLQNLSLRVSDEYIVVVIKCS